MGQIGGWLLVGLVAGGLASALLPGRTPAVFAGVVGLGMVGALLGGWACLLLFGSAPSSFLGSVVVSVLGALGVLALLSHGRHGRSPR